jgi:hypothetical protein
MLSRVTDQILHSLWQWVFLIEDTCKKNNAYNVFVLMAWILCWKSFLTVFKGAWNCFFFPRFSSKHLRYKYVTNNTQWKCSLLFPSESLNTLFWTLFLNYIQFFKPTKCTQIFTFKYYTYRSDMVPHSVGYSLRNVEPQKVACLLTNGFKLDITCSLKMVFLTPKYV